VPALASRAASAGPVVVARLPDLSWLADRSVDGAYAVLVLEHLAELTETLAEAARVVRPGGVLAVVINHPAYTAPGSAPVLDPSDGEVLWRWGPYLEEGCSEVPAGDDAVTFHHRPMGSLLSAAAGAGWCLLRMIEVGVEETQAAADPLLGAQRHIPRLLAARWLRTQA
jgi:SAM-dependent methyltransferase